MYMPTLIRIGRLLFIIHTNDHEPAHVTVYKGKPDNYEAKARIRVADGYVMSAENFSEKELARLANKVTEQREMFDEAWKKTRPKK